MPVVGSDIMAAKLSIPICIAFIPLGFYGLVAWQGALGYGNL